MKIGIITAMSSEQKQVEQLLANKKEYVEGPFQYTEGTIQNNTVILMKCGIGKCGRCNIGDKYVCKDGPVFRCDEIDELPNEY